MSGEAILRKAVTEAQTEVNPNQSITVEGITAIIGAIFEAIRGCRSPATASAHIQRGSAIATLKVRKALESNGYRGDAHAMAAAVVKRGGKLTPEELASIVEESKDLPQPPPASGGFWPMWLIMFALMPAIGQAQETKFWPIDEVQNKRLDEHDVKIAKIQQSLDILRGVTAQPAKPQIHASVQQIVNNPNQSPWVETAIGRTSDEHLLTTHGFTREQIAGLTQAQKDRLHGYAHEHAPAPARVVQSQSGGCPNGVCPMRVRRRGR